MTYAMTDDTQPTAAGPDHVTHRHVKILELAAADIAFKTILKDLIKALAAHGYELTIVCSDGPNVPELRQAGYRVETITIRRNLNLFRHLVTLVQLYVFIKKERFDIVHTHTPVASFLGRIAAKLARVPAIVNTVHGFYFHEDMHVAVRKALIALERFAGRFTDLAFSVSSEDVETAIRERIFPADRIMVVGNGVDLRKFDPRSVEPARRRIRDELGLPLGAAVVGAVGRLVREKGFVELMRAMPRVLEAQPQAKLVIVGDALPSDRRSVKERLLELVNSLKLDDKVVFTGLRYDMPELLSAMDVFVLPSYREGMPLVLLEAMAMARPAVATRVRGCREVVVDGETGILVPPRDVSALADAIVRLLLDNELARRMGLAGRKRVEERFDRDEVIRKQLDALARLASS